MSLSPIEERILSICHTRTKRSEVYKALRDQWPLEAVHSAILSLEHQHLLEEDLIRREHGYEVRYFETTQLGSQTLFGRTSY